MVRACVLPMLLVVAISACGGRHAVVRRPSDDYLAALKIEGNTAISTSYLLPRLALSGAVGRRSIDDYNLLLDKQRIKTAYEKLGYFAADVQARIDRKGNASTVTFVVTEGPRAYTRVQIAGLPDDVSFDKARVVIPIAEGERFDYDKYDGAKDSLQHVLFDAGYAHADVEGSVIADRAHALATVRFAINAGQHCTFGEITVAGAEGLLADSVTARIAFHAGDPFSQSKLDDAQTAIYGTGLFASVRVEADRDNLNTVVPVKVTVTTVTRNEVTAGGGVGLDPLTYNARLRGTWVRHDFITPLTTMNIDLRPEYAVEREACDFGDLLSCKRDFRGRLLGTLTQQDLLVPDVKGEIEGGLDYIVWEPYAVLDAHIRLGLSKKFFGTKLQARIGWQLGYYDFPDVYVDHPTAQLLGIDHTNFVGAYTGALVLDLRDKPLAPTQGFYFDARVTKGTRYAGGDFSYLEINPDMRAFLPLGPVVLAMRVRVGAIIGDVPATERFFGGGISSMRGFGQRRLSPYAPSEFDGSLLPIGGAGLVESSIELRVPIGSPWGIDLGAVVFFDAGNVWLSASQIDPADLFYATGFGVRWLSPIGPVGADLGFRLNGFSTAEPGVEERVVPQIAVGEAF
ncbi:MAG TPA: BamA/TamA family outer membrane protein [Kofleriaceae bacterium]|jgi:outer membrane protein assembly factor BamA